MIVVLAAVQSATRLSMIYQHSFRDAFQRIAQSNTTLLDCVLFLMQYLCRHATKLCKLVYPWESVLKSIYQGSSWGHNLVLKRVLVTSQEGQQNMQVTIPSL